MAMKDFDAKAFMLEKGERVGLGVALFLMVLLIIVSLFLPSRGFFSGSPKDKADVLEKNAASAQNALRSSQPGDDDKPKDPKTTLAAVKEFNPLDGGPYQYAGLFAPSRLGPAKRRQPEQFQPLKDGVAAIAMLQLDSIMMKPQGNNIMIYLLDDADARGARGFGGLPGMFGRGGRGGRGGMPPGMPSMGGSGRGRGGPGGPGGPGRFMGGGGMPGMPGGLGGLDNKKDFKLKAVPLNKLSEESSPHYARQVLPLRAAMIAASFPYRAQLEEFRDKLRLSSVEDVLADQVVDPNDPEATPKPAFRFLRVEVQRAELGPEGKVILRTVGNNKNVDWETLDLKTAYTPYLVLAAKEQEPEDPKLEQVIFDGLVMPRLKLFRDENQDAGGDGEKKETHNEYPKVEDRLPSLRKALEELKGKGPVLKPPSQFTVEGNFDIFSQRRDEGAQGGAGVPGGPGMPAMPGGPGGRGGFMPPGRGGMGRMPGEGGPGLGGRRGKGQVPGTGGPGGMIPGGPPGAEGQQEAQPPEYCLVRLIDPTVEPGKVYKYRIRVRMANPNYNRPKEVASLAYSQKKELDVDEKSWVEIEKPVQVPPELLYYAVDQQDLDGLARYRGIHRGVYPNKDRTVLQIHRWLETFSMSTDRNSLLPVGEWVVAERVIAHRGEYVGSPQRIEFPYWRTTQEQFIIAQEPKATRRAPSGVMVNFRAHSPDGRDTVLVDFAGGNQDYERVVSRDEDGKTTTRKLRDAFATEIMLLTPDGKLLAHEGAADAADKERVKRLDEVKRRIREVKVPGAGGAQPGAPGRPGGGRNPFGT